MIYLLLEDFSTAFLLVPASLASLDFFRAGFSGCASIFGSLAGTVVTIRVTSTLNPPILHFLVQNIFLFIFRESVCDRVENDRKKSNNSLKPSWDLSKASLIWIAKSVQYLLKNKDLQSGSLIRSLKNFQVMSKFSTNNLIYRGCNCIYHDWGCKSIYPQLSCS